MPQNRRRLFIVGLPPGINYDFPTPTHGTAECPFATVRGALLDAPADEANTAKVVYAKNPVLRRSPFAGMLLNGKGRPLNLDAPSNTIPATAGGNRTHVLDPDGVLTAYHKGLLRGDAARTGLVPGCRRLTVRESARLQTFPDWFEIKGRKSQQYAQVGNAVPPMLAKVVAASIREALNSGDVQTYAAEPIPHYV